MFFYELGYGSYEDSGVVWLMHKRSFRQHQYNKMVFDCAVDAAKEYHADQVKFYQEINARRKEEGTLDEDDIDLLYNEKNVNLSWSDIYKRTAELMCERHGFEQPQIKAEWWGWGWSNMLSPFDLKHNFRDRLQKKLCRKLQEILPWEDPWPKRAAQIKKKIQKKKEQEEKREE